MKHKPWTRKEKAVAWRWYMRNEHLPRQERCETIARVMGRPVELVTILMGRIRTGDEPRPYPALPHELKVVRAAWFFGFTRMSASEACPACPAHPRHESGDPLSAYCELCEGFARVPVALAIWYRTWADGDGTKPHVQRGPGAQQEATARDHFARSMRQGVLR